MLDTLLNSFIREQYAWWDVAIMPKVMRPTIPDDVFRDSLRVHCAESSSLLHKAIDRTKKGDIEEKHLVLFDPVTFVGPFMGMLERYSMGMRIESPLYTHFKALLSARKIDVLRVRELRKFIEGCGQLSSRQASSSASGSGSEEDDCET